ncbi:MAG: amino acid ABC transporter substrate-binding protein [Gracilibacteraceae bacterium]|jgi:polar amino acid transport system substrate-binding protein|nr:amino acid ABC transporter substrate-binding protein [Gracilibacteraceae bacterium]
MKKITVVLFCLVCLLALSLTACSQPAASTPPAAPPAETPTAAPPEGEDTSWTDIQAKGYMVVGLDASFPPMGFTDPSGEIVGFDIDFAKAVAEKLGIEVRFEPISWDAKFLELNNKNIDLIWNGMTITEERLAETLMTRPYLGNRQIIVVPGDSTLSKADLPEKTIGVQAGSTSADVLQADVELMETIAMVEFPDNVAALLDLKNGQLDAVVVDEVVGRYYVNLDAASYKILEEDFGEEEFGVAVRKTDAAFLAELQGAMDAVVADGQAAVIATQWFNENIVK